MEQGTGNREHGAGNREQGTGNREPRIGNDEWESGNERTVVICLDKVPHSFCSFILKL